MKTREDDRRVQRTRRTLREALIALILENGYDQVTVQHIIDRADVGRSTFYAHFENKDKLLLSGFENVREMLVEANTEHEKKQKETGDFSFNSLKIFQHADENRRIYRALAGRSGGDLFLKQMFRELYDISLTKIQSSVSKEDKDSVLTKAAANFFASSLVSLLTFWLDNNLSLTPQQIDQIFKQLTMSGIKSVCESKWRIDNPVHEFTAR